jgi:NAD(P)-dependent dehydrogenase (short-subunit alcohol dehydrogenase family)
MQMLKDSVVLVTGGMAGQGYAHAIVSAREGADIVIVDVQPLDHEGYGKVQQDIEDLGREAICLQANVADSAELRSAVMAAVERFGRIDKAIVNAGIFRGGPLVDMPEEHWNQVFDVNLTGAWNTIKAVAPQMIERQAGSIVVISSTDGLAPHAGTAGYGISKAGAISLAQYAAAELGEHGIRVNAIAPGFVDTAMVNSQRFLDMLAGEEGAGTHQHLLDYGKTQVVLKGKTVLPAEEIAKVALFLNSDLASSVTGTVIPVDAGHLLLPHVKA